MNPRHTGSSGATVGIIFFLVASVLAVYWQTNGHAFIEYDDQIYLLENPHVRNGFSLENMKWAFSAGYAANWHPLTWLSHMLDVKLYGLNPTGHHLTSVFLHAFNAVLLFTLMSRITGALWKSALVALLFALHPLHVESVAWAAERKDVLSTLFWLVSLHLYARYVKSPTPSRYILVVITFCLGLMSKPMLVTLPFVLLLMDFWPLQRTAFWSADTITSPRYQTIRFLILEKLPFLLIAAATGIITVVAQQRGNAMTPLVASPLTERLQNALIAYIGYLGKMFWPTDLAVFYPFQTDFPAWKVLCAACLLIAVSVIVFRERRHRPYLLFGWSWYIITLAPVIGIVRVGLQAMADRYTYMPLTGIFIALAWGAEEWLERCDTRPRKLLYGLTAAMITVCILLTWHQIRYWRDTTTLFTHALESTRNNYMAHSVLGRHLEREGRLEQALTRFSEALEIAPWYEYAKVHQGIILMNQGRLDAAVFKYNEAIIQNPTSVSGHINLGIVMGLQGRHEDAIRNFRIAINFNPHSEAAHYNLGVELAKTGKFEDAIQHYYNALKIDPGDMNCHNNLGVALAELGRLDEAISHFNVALKLKPDFFDAYSNRELAFKKLGHLPSRTP
jgi:Flp pilus assembly protein TadD